MVEQISFLSVLRLLGEKCPICHHSRMSLMKLYTDIAPHSLESIFKLIPFSLTESIAEVVFTLI